MSSKIKLDREPRRRACAVCLQNGRLLAVRLKDPTSGVEFMTPPGGAIEEGEAVMTAAVRETLEETGYRVRGREPEMIFWSRYTFEWDGAIRDCLTAFVVCDLDETQKQPAPVSDASYLLGAAWVPIASPGESLSSDFFCGVHIKDLPESDFQLPLREALRRAIAAAGDHQ